MKKCLECELEKELEEFYITKKGHYSYCRTCHSKHGEERSDSLIPISKKYGISVENLYLLLKNQNHKCKICDKEILFKTKFIQNRACVDHQEGTLNIRGLLCHNCNSGLGHFKHEIQFLSEAINYLNNPITHIGDEKLRYIRRNKKRINSSGYLGVTFDKKHKQFKAKLVMMGKTINIGYYLYAEEAAIAYNKYIKENIPNYEYIITLNEIPLNWKPIESSFELKKQGHYKYKKKSLQIHHIEY